MVNCIGWIIKHKYNLSNLSEAGIPLVFRNNNVCRLCPVYSCEVDVSGMTTMLSCCSNLNETLITGLLKAVYI